MSDAPDWIEAAVEQAAEEVRRIAPLCSESGSVFAGMSRCTYTKCWQPCVCAAQARAALAAFLRSFPKDATLRRWEDRETGHVARLPGRELHYLASAIERLGAPEKSEGGT